MTKGGLAMAKEIIVDVPGVVPYTVSCHAVKVGHTIYVAGQVGRDTQGNIVGKSDIRAQATQAFENLKAVLAAAGASLSDVVKLMTYIVDLKYYPELAEVRARYLKPRSCASTLVVVKGLGSADYLLEIEAIAVVD
jgi:reactive intermediate/imine deaminase